MDLIKKIIVIAYFFWFYRLGKIDLVQSIPKLFDGIFIWVKEGFCKCAEHSRNHMFVQT